MGWDSKVPERRAKMKDGVESCTHTHPANGDYDPNQSRWHANASREGEPEPKEPRTQWRTRAPLAANFVDHLPRWCGWPARAKRAV